MWVKEPGEFWYKQYFQQKLSQDPDLIKDDAFCSFYVHSVPMKGSGATRINKDNIWWEKIKKDIK